MPSGRTTSFVDFDHETASHVLTSTFVLSGLRLNRERALDLFRRIRAVEESTTYQYILEQGELKAVRRLVLRHGARKLGTPGKRVKEAIQELDNLPRLERILDAISSADSWNEALATH